MSKAMNILFTAKLNKELEKKGSTTISISISPATAQKAICAFASDVA